MPYQIIAKVLASSLSIAAVFLMTGTSEAKAESVTVKSPDASFTIEFSLGAEGRPSYRVNRSGRSVIEPSGLGFVLEKDVDWTRGFDDLSLVKRGSHDSVWTPTWGERSSVRDHYNSATVHFKRAARVDPKTSAAAFQIEIRAYDEGVAFRYFLDKKPSDVVSEAGFKIDHERTHFQLTEDHDVWAVTSAQGKYSKVKVSEVRHSIERPCVLETSAGRVIAIAEAALVDYSRMRLSRSDSPKTLTSKLHSPATIENFPWRSPWRVVMEEKSAADLLNRNYLILNLNEPCAIADTSWIKPGKVIRDVSLSTKGGKACVDFAVKYGLQYVEFDAGWYGNERKEESDARTVSRRDLDLKQVIRYGKERGVGILVYVNRRHLERQLDELLPLYKEWGLKGIKYGFVQHGSQKWTEWMHDAIRKTAKYELMVDVHDEYRMTGWERTYPNFMTSEGIGGDETRPPHEQALANLFTRMIAGPADHTFCYFNGYADRTSSHASQLAKSVLFFSPWQFLFWYDRPSSAHDEPELQFFKNLPTTWDESRALDSKIGQYGSIARRKGEDWFLGLINASQERSFDIALDFLRDGVKYTAHIYTDDANAKTRTHVGIEKRSVDSTATLHFKLGVRGGTAVRFVAN